jgi:hypothetical protein
MQIRGELGCQAAAMVEKTMSALASCRPLLGRGQKLLAHSDVLALGALGAPQRDSYAEHPFRCNGLDSAIR